MFLVAEVNTSNNISARNMRFYTNEAELVRGLEFLCIQQQRDKSPDQFVELKDWINTSGFTWNYRIYQGTVDCNCTLHQVTIVPLRKIVAAELERLDGLHES